MAYKLVITERAEVNINRSYHLNPQKKPVIICIALMGKQVKDSSGILDKI